MTRQAKFTPGLQASPQTREALQISLRNGVIIFDEGHNIEKSSGMFAPFELSSGDHMSEPVNWVHSFLIWLSIPDLIAWIIVLDLI